MEDEVKTVVEETPPVEETPAVEVNELAEFEAKMTEYQKNYDELKNKLSASEEKYQNLLKKVNSYLPSFQFEESQQTVKSEQTGKEYKFVDPWESVFK